MIMKSKRYNNHVNGCSTYVLFVYVKMITPFPFIMYILLIKSCSSIT